MQHFCLEDVRAQMQNTTQIQIKQKWNMFTVEGKYWCKKTITLFLFSQPSACWKRTVEDNGSRFYRLDAFPALVNSFKTLKEKQHQFINTNANNVSIRQYQHQTYKHGWSHNFCTQNHRQQIQFDTETQ